MFFPPSPKPTLEKSQNTKSFSFCFLKSPQYELLKTISKFKSIREKVRKKNGNITTGEQGGGNSFLALMQAYPIFLR